jgi:hypothetical protein
MYDSRYDQLTFVEIPLLQEKLFGQRPRGLERHDPACSGDFFPMLCKSFVNLMKAKDSSDFPDAYRLQQTPCETVTRKCSTRCLWVTRQEDIHHSLVSKRRSEEAIQQVAFNERLALQFFKFFPLIVE